jgi:hypothetical protein
VWLQNSSADLASEKLTFDLRSLAWGAGVGARLDFEFFIFRVDAALRLHDPVQMARQALDFRRSIKRSASFGHWLSILNASFRIALT